MHPAPRLIHRPLTQLFRIGIAAFAMILSLPGFADSLDLSQPVVLRPERGVALFSFTVSSRMEPHTVLSWRSLSNPDESGSVKLATEGWFKNEELSQTPHLRPGAIFGLDLPPGTYEFYQFRTSGRQRTASAKEDFSRKFIVEAGKINYVGNFDLLTGENDFGGGRLLVAFIFGVFTDAYTAYPTLIDRGEVDIPLIVAKGGGLKAETITRRIVLDEADAAMLSAARELQTKADSGDGLAQHLLLNALVHGWALLPDQRRIKLFESRNTWPDLAAKLSAKGMSGAAAYLGMRYDANFSNRLLWAGIFEKDDPASALEYYLIDAARYQTIAISGAKRLLKKIGGGTESDRLLATLDRRQDALENLSPESLPYGDDATRAALNRYRQLAPPKYFALSANGTFGMSHGDKPSLKAAMERCDAANSDPSASCRPYAMYSRKVWNACPPEMHSEKSMEAPPYTGLGDAGEASRLPAVLDEAARQAYARFLGWGFPRAFAISERGAYASSGGDCQAAYRALLACTRMGLGPCRLWAVDDQIVHGTTDERFVRAERELQKAVARDGTNSDVALTKGRAIE